MVGFVSILKVGINILVENVKAGKKEAEEEPKPVEDGAVPPKCEDEEKSAEVTVQVEIENGKLRGGSY